MVHETDLPNPPRSPGHNLRGGLMVKGVGYYQGHSPTCYADDTCAGAWVEGLEGWQIDELTLAALRWRNGNTGAGEEVERPEIDAHPEPIVLSEYAAKKLAPTVPAEAETDNE